MIPAIFLLHYQDFFRVSLCTPNSIIGIFSGEDLIAYSILCIPWFSGRAMPIIWIWTKSASRGSDKSRPHPGYDYQSRSPRQWLKRKLARAHFLSCGFLIEALRPKFQGWSGLILHQDLMKAHLSPAKDADGRAEQIAISIPIWKARNPSERFFFEGLKSRLSSASSMSFMREPDQREKITRSLDRFLSGWLLGKCHGQ